MDQYRRFKRHLLKDILIAVPIVILINYLIIELNIFQMWFEELKARELFDVFFKESKSVEGNENLNINDYFAISISILVAGTILALRHIFVLKAALQKIERLRNELDKELRLKKQRQKLEALGEMSGGLAHEINNALQPIIGFSDILRRQCKGDAKKEKYIEKILKNTIHTRNIVDSVLTFSRRESNVSHCITDAHDLLSESIDFIRESPDANSINIRFTPAQKEETQDLAVQFDKTAFLQILNNIVKNAIHAMNNEGEVLIHLCKKNLGKQEAKDLEVAPGEYALIDICDHGHGMDDKTLELLFTPFFTTKEEGEGTGLGLSIVYGIIRGAGGTVHVTSEIGVGSTFHIYLPVFDSKNLHGET